MDTGPARRAAREHRELAALLAGGMVSAADHLLRLHLCRRQDPAAWPSPALVAGPESIGRAGA